MNFLPNLKDSLGGTIIIMIIFWAQNENMQIIVQPQDFNLNELWAPKALSIRITKANKSCGNRNKSHRISIYHATCDKLAQLKSNRGSVLCSSTPKCCLLSQFWASSKSLYKTKLVQSWIVIGTLLATHFWYYSFSWAEFPLSNVERFCHRFMFTSFCCR